MSLDQNLHIQISLFACNNKNKQIDLAKLFRVDSEVKTPLLTRTSDFYHVTPLKISSTLFLPQVETCIFNVVSQGQEAEIHQ